MTLCLNPACNASNASNAKFCMKCGTKLLIQDRYRPSKKLGAGSFGKTFLATDQGKPSQPQCVIKQFTFISDNPDIVQKAQELFYQEAKQLEKLGKHPQIPDLYGYCEQENRLYLIQEFVDGENLADELAQGGAFSESKIRQVLVDLLSVLQFLHEHQVIHRDIKPENIMRRRSDQKLVLIDFGAVKQTTVISLQGVGTNIGTPNYKAPEQAKGKPTFSSDLYSLGVSCLQLLTKTEPFDLYDPQEGKLVWRHYLINNSIQEGLGKILDKMTQEEIKQRYHSAQEVFQHLKFLQFPTSTTQISIKDFIETLANGISLEMIAIPGGSFYMGSNKRDEEQPIHSVVVQPFHIGKYPITQEQYESVMGNNPSCFKGAKRPVEKVSWSEAVEFCQKLSQKTGKKYRLPSEAEWEYACRSGTHTEYYFGNDKRKLQDYAWYDENSAGTHPVGEKHPNDWNLYDMHGNVWEWCSDQWHKNYDKAPTDGSSWETHISSTRVLRGGSWRYHAEICLSAFRYGGNYIGNDCGFRVVTVLSRTL